MNTIPLDLNVNGESYHLLVEARRTLLELLHDDLGLVGTKQNCLEGECGVCTVLLDGQAVDSCIYLAVRARGKSVITIEGLETLDGLHPLQASFIDCGAVQCGYCIPGMIMSGVALLEECNAPSEDEIHEALAGNLCRCTGYSKIVDAVREASLRLASDERGRATG